jgi:hypothetical protein
MTSIIKVDNLQNQCGANIISESANVITIGASGDTVTLAAGASQSGFGRSGSVNWDTTPKTSSPVTAVSGNGYFINTTSGAITVNLPATPAAGSIVSIADYNGTAATNNITVGRNSSNINSSAVDFTISRNYAAISFVYVDSTAGWRSVDTSDASSVVNQFVAATGGTITTCGNYKIHTFTGPGTFTVTNTGPQSSTVDYLVVAGGAAGGGGVGGGGGAGGFRESVPAPAAWTASPLASPGGAVPVSVTAYPITVGAGGTRQGPASGRGNSGNNSVFSTITSAGGGGGGSDPGTPTYPGGSGGSGGGGNRNPAYAGGSGNTPPVSPSQGNSGEPGLAGPARGGGGGGAATAGGTPGGLTASYGGTGVGTGINPSPGVGTPGPSAPLRYFAGGGGGGGDWPYTGQGANGGTIGGGGPSYQGPFSPTTPTEFAISGTANTGGGGGGGSNSGGSSGSGSGGSGIVVIRYRFQ